MTFQTQLGEIYGKAESIFEFGLGESTFLADHLRVGRYSGVDSDSEYISTVRNDVSSHFRFYFADIGQTVEWGYPQANLTKSVFNYQILPLLGEPLPFDVYMVDGRFRLSCMLISFLHASDRQKQLQPEHQQPEHQQPIFSNGVFEYGKRVKKSSRTSTTTTTVLVHDCHQEGHNEYIARKRESYNRADHLLDLVKHSGVSPY